MPPLRCSKLDLTLFFFYLEVHLEALFDGHTFQLYALEKLFLLQNEAGRGTESILHVQFTPEHFDNGSFLKCRSENPYIRSSAVEDQWRLDVHCKLNVTNKFKVRIRYTYKSIFVSVLPMVTLRQTALKKEKRTDLTCEVKANPSDVSIHWTKDVSDILFPSLSSHKYFSKSERQDSV